MDNEVIDAFGRLAPGILGGGPEGPLNERNIPADHVAGVGNTLANMFAAQQTAPEEAVPAAFSIGFLVGMSVAEERQR